MITSLPQVRAHSTYQRLHSKSQNLKQDASQSPPPIKKIIDRRRGKQNQHYRKQESFDDYIKKKYCQTIDKQEQKKTPKTIPTKIIEQNLFNQEEKKKKLIETIERHKFPEEQLFLQRWRNNVDQSYKLLNIGSFQEERQLQTKKLPQNYTFENFSQQIINQINQQRKRKEQ